MVSSDGASESQSGSRIPFPWFSQGKFRIAASAGFSDIQCSHNPFQAAPIVSVVSQIKAKAQWYIVLAGDDDPSNARSLLRSNRLEAIHGKAQAVAVLTSAKPYWDIDTQPFDVSSRDR